MVLIEDPSAIAWQKQILRLLIREIGQFA